MPFIPVALFVIGKRLALDRNNARTYDNSHGISEKVRLADITRCFLGRLHVLQGGAAKTAESSGLVVQNDASCWIFDTPCVMQQCWPDLLLKGSY